MSEINISRNITDVKLMANVELPAAGKTTTSKVIDVKQKGGIDEAMIHCSVPALSALASGKKVVAILQSSADGITFSDVESAPVLTVTGAESGGSPGKKFMYRIPCDAERFLRMSVTADSASGTVTGSALSFSVRV